MIAVAIIFTTVFVALATLLAVAKSLEPAGGMERQNLVAITAALWVLTVAIGAASVASWYASLS